MPQVRQRLLGLGWTHGRDVREKVDAWLGDWVDELAALPFERDGYPRYEPFPAALKMLYEFGGLYSMSNGRGITSAQIPFSIYPGEYDDLMQFAVHRRGADPDAARHPGAGTARGRALSRG